MNLKNAFVEQGIGVYQLQKKAERSLLSRSFKDVNGVETLRWFDRCVCVSQNHSAPCSLPVRNCPVHSSSNTISFKSSESRSRRFLISATIDRIRTHLYHEKVNGPAKLNHYLRFAWKASNNHSCKSAPLTISTSSQQLFRNRDSESTPPVVFCPERGKRTSFPPPSSHQGIDLSTYPSSTGNFHKTKARVEENKS